MSRRMATPMVRTPSRSPNAVSAASGEARAMTSCPSWWCRWASSPRQKMSSELPTVAMRMSFIVISQIGQIGLISLMGLVLVKI